MCPKHWQEKKYIAVLSVNKKLNTNEWYIKLKENLH